MAGGPRRRKGGRRITFGCAAALAFTGNGVIAPLRDGAHLGWGVKDMRRPPCGARIGGLGPFHRPGPPQITSRAPHAPHGSRVPRVREERRGCGCEKWRSGRIVPLHTRRPFRGNRGIMRKPPDAPGASARTILPQRQNRNSMGSKSAPGPADADRPARDRDRSARDRGPAAQGRPGRSRKTRREPIRPSMRTRTPPRPRPIPRRGARGACRGGAGEVI